MKATLIGTAKNEGPYLLEWVAYHRAMGFDQILIYENGSDDGGRRILRELNRIGAITYFRNEMRPGNYQIRAYTRAGDCPAFKEADWAMALDLDEFLVVKTGDGTVQDYVNAVPDCDGILVNWRMFGCGGHALPNGRLMTQRFIKAENDTEIATELRAIKTLFRPKIFARPGIHVPRLRDDHAGTARFVNGSGLAEGQFHRKNWRASDPERFKLAQINHYAVRDAGSFLLKTMRGSAHQDKRKVGKHYWAVCNLNEVEERSATRHLDRTRAEMARLDAMTNGLLSDLTARALERRLQAIETALHDPEARSEYLHYLGLRLYQGAYQGPANRHETQSHASVAYA